MQRPFSTEDVDAAAAELIETGAVLLRGVLPTALVQEMRARFQPELEALVEGRRTRKPNEASGDGSTPNRNGFPGGPNRGPERWFMSCELVEPYLKVLEATPLIALMARVFGDDDIALTNIGNYQLVEIRQTHRHTHTEREREREREIERETERDRVRLRVKLSVGEV